MLSMFSKERDTVKVWQFQDTLLEKYCYSAGPAVATAKHCHEDYQFCLGLDFPGGYYYRGTYYLVPKGSLTVLHPGEMHSASNRQDNQSAITYWMMFATPQLMRRMLAEFESNRTNLPFFATPIILDRELDNISEQFYLAVARNTPKLEQDTLLFSMLIELVRRYGDTNRELRPIKSEDLRIKKIREYIDEHFAENIELDRLAKITNLSPYYLNRIFSKQLGLPPHKYQNQLRIDRDLRLILKGFSICAAAEQVGFADQSHLTRYFKRFTGITPARYLLQS